jgi:metal-dependent amidase/aminoacylase/carboxypeptidase family protein
VPATRALSSYSASDMPVLHACGHDSHMTCLVGTARVQVQLRDQWRGTLVLIGQPAEEAGGGARAMLADQDAILRRSQRPSSSQGRSGA